MIIVKNRNQVEISGNTEGGKRRYTLLTDSN